MNNRYKGGKHMAVSMGVVKPLSPSVSRQLLKDFNKSCLKPYTDEERTATMRACKEIMDAKRNKNKK